jgi:hypothetical protein
VDKVHHEVAEYLLQHHRQDPKVIDHYERRLKQGDAMVWYDLIRVRYVPLPGQAKREPQRVWHQRLIDPLIKQFESDPQKYAKNLECLLLHSADWSTDPKRTARLAAAVRMKYPLLLRANWKDLSEAEAAELSRGCWWLGMTLDRGSLPLLKAALEVTQPVNRRRGAPIAGAQAPFTLMDGSTPAGYAANAILVILDGPPPGFPNALPMSPASLECITKARVRLQAEEAKAAQPKK